MNNELNYYRLIGASSNSIPLLDPDDDYNNLDYNNMDYSRYIFEDDNNNTNNTQPQSQPLNAQPRTVTNAQSHPLNNRGLLYVLYFSLKLNIYYINI